MKKNKLLIAALLLFSSVGTLVGCGETSSSLPPAAIVDGINVNLPKEDIVVGDVLNLDDYITFVSNGNVVNKTYEAILTTPTTATLSGHTLTVTAEGNVNVRINVDEQSARFNFDAISSIKSKFKNSTLGVGKKYYVDNVTLENEQLALTNKGFLHNDNYFAYCFDSSIFPGEDLGELENTWTGLMRNFYGDTYTFNMDNIDGDNLEVLPGKQMDLSNYYFSTDFPLSYTDFTTKDDNTLITTSPKVVDKWISYAISTIYTPSELGFTSCGLYASFENVKTVDNKTVEALVISVFVYGFSDEGVEYTLDNPLNYITNAVLFDKDYYSVPTLNTYIGNRKAPTPLSHAEIITAFDEFTETKTYTMENSLYYTNYSNKPIADPLNGTLPVETYNTYVGTNGWISEFADGMIQGLVSTKDSLYGVYNTDLHGNLLSAPETEKYPEGQFESTDVWSGELDHYLTAIFSSNAPYSSINVLSNEADENQRVIKIGAIGSDYFYLYALNIIQGYGSSLYTLLTDNSQGTPLMAYCVAYVTITDSSITIDVQLDIGNNVLYHMQSKFFDNGIDKLTERIASLTFSE